MASYRYRLGCAVPEYGMATALVLGVRLFDKEAFIHIKESQDDDYWDVVAMFNLTGEANQFAVLQHLFNNAVVSVGGREI